MLDRDIEVAGGTVIPRGTVIDGINKFLKARSNWSSYGVPGYLPAKAFFACLAQREFPTTVLIRPREVMDYLPEPDIFHDVFGHVPLHALRVFADFLQAYGRAALRCEDDHHIKRLGRLFWFTVEFGLIREDGKIKVYGSGLVSSHAESEYSLNGRWEKSGRPAPDCTPRDIPEYRPFDLDRVCETDFEIDHFQPIYYVLDSFEQLRDAMNDYAGEVVGQADLRRAAAR
ncbi:MAG: phenylalanine 4-monooxygenase [Phycisphaerae bacterium]|nr:phenylalanine 4-monooxygenase [Phycisphaerae bacterium]